MPELMRTAAAALIAVGLIALLRKNVPELAYLLAAVVGLGAALVFLNIFSNIRAFLDSLSGAAGLSQTVTAPVFKAMGIGLVSKLAADLCADAGQGAIASAVELVGTAGAVYVAMPLMRGVFDMIGSLL